MHTGINYLEMHNFFFFFLWLKSCFDETRREGVKWYTGSGWYNQRCWATNWTGAYLAWTWLTAFSHQNGIYPSVQVYEAQIWRENNPLSHFLVVSEMRSHFQNVIHLTYFGCLFWMRDFQSAFPSPWTLKPTWVSSSDPAICRMFRWLLMQVSYCKPTSWFMTFY